MKKIFFVLLFVLVTTLSCLGQVKPRFEIYGDYVFDTNSTKTMAEKLNHLYIQWKGKKYLYQNDQNDSILFLREPVCYFPVGDRLHIFATVYKKNLGGPYNDNYPYCRGFEMHYSNHVIHLWLDSNNVYNDSSFSKNVSERIRYVYPWCYLFNYEALYETPNEVVLLVEETSYFLGVHDIFIAISKKTNKMTDVFDIGSMLHSKGFNNPTYLKNAWMPTNNQFSFIVGYNGTIDINFNMKIVEGKFVDVKQMVVTNIAEKLNSMPINFSLSQNYPNPFNPSTSINYSLPQSEFVNLKIYNSLGQEVRTLVNEIKPAGNYSVQFDAKGLPSGIYFYKLQAGNYSEMKKMSLLK